MSSKNNPELRGAVTELRKFDGKTVKPTLIIDSENRVKFIGGCFEDGTIVVDKASKRPIPYTNI